VLPRRVQLRAWDAEGKVVVVPPYARIEVARIITDDRREQVRS
jgi:hypothetical protein